MKGIAVRYDRMVDGRNISTRMEGNWNIATAHCISMLPNGLQDEYAYVIC